MNQETSVIQCKECGLTKVRLLSGKRGKDKIWVDENGREFNGKLCPACHSERVAKRKREPKKNSYV